MIENDLDPANRHPILELQTTFLRDVLWNNHFPSKDFESSNWNNQKQDGCLEFQDQNQKSTWNFAKFVLRIEWVSKKKNIPQHQSQATCTHIR